MARVDQNPRVDSGANRGWYRGNLSGLVFHARTGADDDGVVVSHESLLRLY
jgi:hypothetical protein